MRDDDQADDRAQGGGDIDCRGTLSLSRDRKGAASLLIPYGRRRKLWFLMVCLALCCGIVDFDFGALLLVCCLGFVVCSVGYTPTISLV